MSKKIIIIIIVFLLVFVSFIYYKKQVKIDNLNKNFIIENNNSDDLNSIKHSLWWDIN